MLFTILVTLLVTILGGWLVFDRKETCMSPKLKRLILFGVAAIFLATAVGLTVSALKENIVYFYTPSDIDTLEIGNRAIRMGGLVQKDSIRIDGLTARFVVEDVNSQQAVIYTGALPDIFRGGQGVIVEGKFNNDTFNADTVMAKHDEQYMPREVADKLKEQGVWQGEATK